MNPDVVFDINVRIKILELFKDVEQAIEAYAWVVEKAKTPSIIPVTKEVKIVSA
jgi:hypothetical protein